MTNRRDTTHADSNTGWQEETERQQAQNKNMSREEQAVGISRHFNKNLIKQNHKTNKRKTEITKIQKKNKKSKCNITSTKKNDNEHKKNKNKKKK